ncbi:MAG: helix-turn-helix transcriptional regulator [Pseudomonadota bacterium]
MSIHMAPSEFAHVVSIDETQKRLGHLVMLQRQSLKMTQGQLAGRSGLTQSQICRFEKNGEMTYEIFMRACRSLDLDAWVVLKTAQDTGTFTQTCTLKARLA